MASPNPASQDWVQAQLAKMNAALTAKFDKLPKPARISTFLTSDDWAAVCNAGSSPDTSAGCYGSASTSAFAKLDNGLRGFSSLANFNINLASPPSSVYIKAFLADANVPVAQNAISVSVVNAMVRCTLYVEKGTGINSDNGLDSEILTPGNSNRTGPQGPYLATINNQASVQFYYNNSPNAATANPPDPIYLICVGVNSSDGYTPTSIAGAITAL